MHMRTVAAGALLLVLAVGLVSASSMSLSGPSASVNEANHPCPGTAISAATSGSVELTLTSDTCSGLPVQLTLLDGSGNALSNASGTVSGHTATLSLPTTGAVAATAVVDGWSLPVSWTAPPEPTGPIYPSNPDTELTDVNWRLMNQTSACVDLTVTTQSPTPVLWALTVDLSQAPYNGASASSLSLQGFAGWRYTIAADTPEPGFAQIKGNPWAGRQTIVAGQEYDIRVCSWGLPEGVDTPSAYTVTTINGPTPNARRACVTTTVAGNGTSQFYVGWSADIDATAAADHLTDAGRTIDAWIFQPDNGSITTTQTGPATFHVTSTWRSTIADTDEFEFTTCAVDY